MFTRFHAQVSQGGRNGLDGRHVHLLAGWVLQNELAPVRTLLRLTPLIVAQEKQSTFKHVTASPVSCYSTHCTVFKFLLCCPQLVT